MRSHPATTETRAEGTALLFSRSKSETTSSDLEGSVATRSQVTSPGTSQGKGRPTPTRKEAEAATRARARVPRTRKEAAARERMVKGESSQKVRAGMRAGDERYLLPRDKGPVRRFCRDFVDTRSSVLELAIPLLLVSLVLGYAGAPGVSEAVMFASLLMLGVQCVILRARVRREVTTRFPQAPLKGLTYYTVSRATALRFMRMPKPHLKRGDPLPEHYR